MYKLAEDDSNFVIEEVPPLLSGASQRFGEAGSASGSVYEDLASSSPAAIFAVLEHEPAALVAQILAARQWEWREGLLALYSRERCEEIAIAPLEHAPALLSYALRNLAYQLS